MKKIKIFLVFLLIFLITGCTDSLNFKDEYEKVNGTKNKNGIEYRTVSIPKVNPFVYKKVSDIVKMVENKETFIVYFGFDTCPWCRSMIETLIEVASELKIKTIYYVDVKEKRDVKTYEDGKIITTKEASEDYYKLLNYMSDVLERYTITYKGEKKDLGEYRIYAPNVISVIDGKAVGLTTGISNLQTDGYMDLTDEMKKESYNKIKKVLLKDSCDESMC